MTRPQTISLDGDGWTVYWLPPGDAERLRVWEAAPAEAAERRVAAPVPGHVLEALLPAGSEERAAFYRDQLFRDWSWVAAREWVYEKRFQAPADLEGNTVRLRLEGVDDTCRAYLNGEPLGEHDGQFVPAEWEVTGLLRPAAENHLVVAVALGDGERRWKTRFAGEEGSEYAPVGLWGPVSLVVSGRARFLDASVHTNLSIDRTEAAVSIVAEFRAAEVIPAVVVTDITQDGLPVTSVEDPIRLFPGDTSLVQSCEIPRVRLWWPNGHGPQPLYQARITLVDAGGQVLDQRTLPFGVRKVEAVPCEGAGPDTLPYGLEVNGRRVWIKGWTWQPVDLFYGSVPAERYERLLRLAQEANLNLLRVRAPGLIETETFYRLCDRLGIMVWQDFPQANAGGADPLPEDPAYLEYIRDQSEAILALRRAHPSLVLWCGGGDLLDAGGVPLGSDHPALAELRAAVETEDPQRLWLPASPSGPHAWASPEHAGRLHDAHGPVTWMGLAGQPERCNTIDPLLHSEFAALTVNGAATLEAAFGPDAGEAGVRLLQALGVQYAVEADRRRQWRCAGALPWGFNQPAPERGGAAAVAWDGSPTETYAAVRRAYAPFHVSAAFPTFHWAGEPAFRADVWLHNDGPERSLLNVVASITDLDGRELYQESLAAEAPENGSEMAGDLLWRFPADFAQPFILRLEVIDEEGDTLARNAYPFSRAGSAPFAPFLRPEHAERWQFSKRLHHDR